MSDKTILFITGGNTGIGYETVKALAQTETPYTILMGSRSLEKGKDAISKLQSEVKDSKSEILPIEVDIEKDDTIERAFKEVESKYGRIDVLVNNAGASYDSVTKEKPGPAGIREAFNRTYDVNVTGTHVLTTFFAPLLIKSSDPRLLFITSGLSSLTEQAAGRASNVAKPMPAGWPKPEGINTVAYQSSKVALNFIMLDWQRIFKADRVKTWCISPGFLATGLAGTGADLLRKFGAGEPHEGGHFIRDVVQGKWDTHTGQVIRKDGQQAW